MNLDKKVFVILGIVLVIAIIGICWVVCRPSDDLNEGVNDGSNNVVNNDVVSNGDFIINNLGADSGIDNDTIDLNAILKKVRDNNVKDLKGVADKDIDIRIKIFEVDHLEYAYATADNGDKHTEVWLAKNSMRYDNMVLEGYSRRAEDFRFSKSKPDIIIKEEAGLSILIISNVASDIEKTIDDAIVNASAENTIINVKAEGTVSETETFKDSVNVEIKVEKGNLEKAEIYANEHRSLLEEPIEAIYNDEKQAYEAEIKFENTGGNEGIYQISGVLTDANGNKLYVDFPEVMRMPKEMMAE